ncbi:MAG: Re/Si-specific NAD(P)(+) transhydrogenase subunit alpha [Flavobacteriales bacterium]|nr:Re/Si-specific NAD(P)(+) transhydrogenase subunit alpha [Flavobacteriales bacterium]
MQIGVLKELNDNRVAIALDLIKKLVKDSHQVVFESEAGVKALITDEMYSEAGATKMDRASIIKSSDLIMTISPITAAEAATIKEGATLVALFQPFNTPEVCETFNKNKATVYSLDMIPRSTIAQAVDVLSSMASISGYKAVLKATEVFPRYMPMLSSAAGTIPPAKALIIGAGVAGLQAIATAKRMGAQVEAFDTRAAAKEEVMSLGAKFVEVEGASDDKGAGGYAVEQSEEYKKRQQELVAQKIQKADIVITTAQLRGRPAPKIITKEMVDAMRPGSVIVDLASSTGGNCEYTKDQQTVIENGVYIIGDSELSAQIPEQASQLFSRNMENFLKFLAPKGEIVHDFSSPVLRGSCIAYGGNVVYGNTDSLAPAKEETKSEA